MERKRTDRGPQSRRGYEAADRRDGRPDDRRDGRSADHRNNRPDSLRSGRGQERPAAEPMPAFLRLGEMQTLTCLRVRPQGAYLGRDGEEGDVLLPKAQIPKDLTVGGQVEVFLYKDSQDRPVASVRRPALLRGEIGLLPVGSVTDVGAFLKWGLEKDLLLPYREQTHKVQEGEVCPVALYVDRSGRLCATMRLYGHLSEHAPYLQGDTVSGILYEIKKGLGGFVAVDKKYHGLIPEREMLPQLAPGTEIRARVTSVRKDGKLVLSVRAAGAAQMKADEDRLIERLEEAGGVLPYGDKSDPKRIRSGLAMTKAAFKRACGHLYKEGRITLTPESIALRTEDAAPARKDAAAAGHRDAAPAQKDSASAQKRPAQKRRADHE